MTTRIFTAIALYFLFVSPGDIALGQDVEMIKFNPKVKYKDFTVSIYKGTSAQIDLNSNIWARRFRTRLRAGYKESGINFAGHYTFVYWGCGSPCQQSAIIDVITGKIYDAPGAGNGYDYRKNSRMLIVNPPDSNSNYMKDVFWAIPEIYILDDSTKKFKKRRY